MKTEAKCWCGHSLEFHGKDRLCFHFYYGNRNEKYYPLCYCESFRARPVITQEDRDWLRGYSDLAREHEKGTFGVWSEKWVKVAIQLASGKSVYSDSLWLGPYGQGRGDAACDAFGL